MPIKFRCQHCRQFLGISRSKAGEIVDCPTCGRQIRVPRLDGRVDPVPLPKLNLQDSNLASALDELADIDGERTDSGSDEPTEPESLVSPAASAPAVVDLPPLPVPEPVELSAPLPAEPVALPDPGAGYEIPESDPLESLPKTGPAAAASAAQPSAPPGKLIAIAGGACLVVGLLLGYLIPRGSSEPDPDSKSPDVAKTDTKPKPVETTKKKEPPPPPPPADAALYGIVKYTTSDGVEKPDRGARVIAFPIDYQGKSKLSLAGFRPSAADLDVKFARAALNAIGGDIAIVDDRGAYALKLVKSKRYRLLAISRFQQDLRADPDPPPAEFLDLVRAYFLQPNQFQQQILAPVRFQEQVVLPAGTKWDYTFAAK